MRQVIVANAATMLQVAAVIREGDTMALAQALQQKKFPAFVITPGTDKYYRVQVGPYADTQSATSARQDPRSQRLQIHRQALKFPSSGSV